MITIIKEVISLLVMQSFVLERITNDYYYMNFRVRFNENYLGSIVEHIAEHIMTFDDYFELDGSNNHITILQKDETMIIIHNDDDRNAFLHFMSEDQFYKK